MASGDGTAAACNSVLAALRVTGDTPSRVVPRASATLADRFQKRWTFITEFPGWSLPQAKLASEFRQYSAKDTTAHIYGNNAIFVDDSGRPSPVPTPGRSRKARSMCLLCLQAMLKQENSETGECTFAYEPGNPPVVTEFGRSIKPDAWEKSMCTNMVHSKADPGGATAFKRHLEKFHAKHPDMVEP